MNEINEIKIPKWVESISVEQHDDKVVIEFIPKEPKFKNGDFVYEYKRIMIVKSYPRNYHAIVLNTYPELPIYDSTYGLDFSEPTFRHATEEEKQMLIDAMKKDGKRWNAEKLEIEDIPKCKFKAGDKVKIKDGISSKTHRFVSPIFTEYMDKFIGKELTVIKYTEMGYVECTDGFYFAEDWLEPWSEEPKNGDLAIFWDDDDKGDAIIRLYNRKDDYEFHRDSRGILWTNAIKFESKEQYEKILRGEI